jgi:Zn-dependent protease with chaperone function
MTTNTWILHSKGAGLWKAVGYFGPAVTGAVVVFFMIKPILARPARGTDPVEIWPAEQPTLFEFIRAVCTAVGAPFPTRIRVDCQVNASAGLIRTPWSLRAPDFVLTIGLPLAAGLTVRQFAGVLAHEFGHFSQTGGMRLTFIVRTINHWLARVAHERDAWDQKLADWGESGTLAVTITFQIAKLAVWFSRKILVGLMYAGHAISSFMLRQMEYDADSYEVKLVGTEAFLSTSTRMRELGAGAQFGYHDLQNAWVRRTLPANFPAYLLGHAGRLPDGLLATLRELPENKTGLLDTHPSDTDRADAATALQSVGIFEGSEQPASVLFRDFDALAVRATRHHYTNDLGLPLDSATLVDSDSVLAATGKRERWQEAVLEIFADTLTFLRPISAPWPPPSLAMDAALSASSTSRDAMVRDRENAAAKVRRYEELVNDGELAESAIELLQAGFAKVPPDHFHLTETNGDARKALQNAKAAQQAIEPELQRYERLTSDRIGAALALLANPRAIPPSTRAELTEEATRIVPALNAFARVWPIVREVNHVAGMHAMLESNVEKSGDQTAAVRQVSRLASRVYECLRQIGTDLRTAPGLDPLQPSTLSGHLGFRDGSSEFPAAASVVAAAAAIRFDLVGRLATIVIAVEAKMSGAAPSSGA